MAYPPLEQNFQSVRRPVDRSFEGVGAARFPLSASLDGAPISASIAAPTKIHTFPVNTNAIEELYLYASNYSNTDLNISMSVATSAATAFTNYNYVITPVPSRSGLSLIYPGVPHKSTDIDNPLHVYIKTETSAAALNVVGYVLRYYPREKGDEEKSKKFGYSLT